MSSQSIFSGSRCTGMGDPGILYCQYLDSGPDVHKLGTSTVTLLETTSITKSVQFLGALMG